MIWHLAIPWWEHAVETMWKFEIHGQIYLWILRYSVQRRVNLHLVTFCYLLQSHCLYNSLHTWLWKHCSLQPCHWLSEAAFGNRVVFRQIILHQTHGTNKYLVINQISIFALMIYTEENIRDDNTPNSCWGILDWHINISLKTPAGDFYRNYWILEKMTNLHFSKELVWFTPLWDTLSCLHVAIHLILCIVDSLCSWNSQPLFKIEWRSAQGLTWSSFWI